LTKRTAVPFQTTGCNIFSVFYFGINGTDHININLEEKKEPTDDTSKDVYSLLD